MTLARKSFGKINLLLNILGKRPDGFHELETILQPVGIFDELVFEKLPRQVTLTCNNPLLPTDASNLVVRAAEKFFASSRIDAGIRIHLEKRLPLAAGLGGGSSNAATTLSVLNEIFGCPLTPDQLQTAAAALGSDVPFFLQNQPALATGRGERVQPLDFFSALENTAMILVHPGFGIATPWAYRQLDHFPSAQNGRPGRALELVSILRTGTLAAAGKEFYNALESPALKKFPLLVLFQDFFRDHGAAATLMSGSGSTTFAIFSGAPDAERALEKFHEKFGPSSWTALVAHSPREMTRTAR
jgi:4-diphosphocytidyl-2-C-methyl-D-erythritol kinase